ncbi:metal ABC transporter substrate-binding protein [Actinoplanes friuliensis]|jgi:zinc transport system substrate-binding protein|uniref:Putative ABC transporter substrate-binding protein n=1 Tax=Actinoplanes friuliensis DSM 7358 TaxID=1246995 RepID=U5VSW4_9ACTN|nr:metal ABC transporter substrate-binding protein [Actinoplanes friuliensis]AGZ39907.1 putative ABC transporter substrate-binding protein [Actinoplanes friuliensis DSM 7358]
MMQPRRLLAATAIALLVGASAACADEASGFAADGRLDVVTAFYPLQFLSERIGGDAVAVTELTKPGAEPHDVELNPRQVGAISDAGLVVYLSGFQPAVDEAVQQEAANKAFDAGSVVELLAAADGHEHAPGEEEHAEEGKDPHVWLDPVRFATITDRLAERFGQADPARAATYTERAKTLHTELDALNTEFATALKTCERRELVTSHTAFRYLADRYDLTEVGITGISPESEPSPKHLAHVAEEARETGTTTIFFETLVSPKVAETIAREVGAKTAVLDPLEGLTEPDADYFSVMRSNLTALTSALGCTS